MCVAEEEVCFRFFWVVMYFRKNMKFWSLVRMYM